MNKLKSKLSLVLVAIMLMATFMPIFTVNAAVEMSLTVEYKGNELEEGKALNIKPGSVIDVTVNTPYTEGLEIAYYWNAGSIKTFPIGQKSAKITLPNFEEGTTNSLQVQAIINDYTHGINKVIDKFVYRIEVPADETDIYTTLKRGSSVVPTNTEVEIPVGTELTAIATSTNGVKTFAYRWDSETLMQFPTGTEQGVLYVPNYKAGSLHTLKVQAVSDDGTKSTPKEYKIRIPAEAALDVDMSLVVKQAGKTLTNGQVLTLEPGAVFDASVITSHTEGLEIAYYWNAGAIKTFPIGQKTGKITLPNFGDGTSNLLQVQAIINDFTHNIHEVIDVQTFTVLIEDDDYEDDDYDNGDELIIEPWMEENDDLDGISVSLRNDSDEEKANKNIYALNEEVIYYVDYKNGGKDIKKKVTLVLNVPETFKVLSADGGKVSTSNGTITWTFNGLEEDEAGTKTVVLKYTKIGSSKTTHKFVKPLAEIKVDNKVKDNSAVLNLIYKDRDTEINDLHIPYMKGDEEKPTFRPDDIITRAEGALVLTRIFGISTAYDKSTHNYPDLNETYLEARKAIIAATEYGIINGYEDGTYKPNKPMTRAEFLKIIAKRVEIENGDGFEIKDLEASLKVYDDPTRVYFVNSDYLTKHWALEEVTLLARLNMTPLTEKKTNLRLDEPITRAEVAQLVNFYLLRAPAEITSKTKSGFIDTTKNHKLFADIIEATRGAHTYFITDETTEEAEY